jgi:hypothetical protein
MNSQFTECDTLVTESSSSINQKWSVETWGTGAEGPSDRDAYYTTGTTLFPTSGGMEADGDTLLHIAVRENKYVTHAHF